MARGKTHPDAISRDSREVAAHALHRAVLQAMNGGVTMPAMRAAVGLIIEAVHDERGRDTFMEGGEEAVAEETRFDFDPNR